MNSQKRRNKIETRRRENVRRALLFEVNGGWGRRGTWGGEEWEIVVGMQNE